MLPITGKMAFLIKLAFLHFNAQFSKLYDVIIFRKSDIILPKKIKRKPGELQQNKCNVLPQSKIKTGGAKGRGQKP